MNEKIRLQKYLSECGIASRRKSEELIEKGSVKINGRLASLGEKINPKTDNVSVNGKKVKMVSQHRYIMLNKPRGFITTMSDEQGRRCVAELITDTDMRLYPVGRLDRDSEGLLLFTNDGEFANALTHPSKHISKIYRVTIRPDISEEEISNLSSGIILDGRRTLPADVKVVLKEDNRTVLEITLYEGRNRQIRRMLEDLDINTIRLKRIAVGDLRLGMLKAGAWRDLTSDEVQSLKRSVGLYSPKNLTK